jgi:NAD(P)-dependent dehydrogenase (short-subunit alcohol dehydrogenase family)
MNRFNLSTQKIDLANKVAVINGATSRIGFALALRAAQQGMKVAIVDGDEVRLALALKRLREKELRSIALHRDASELAEVRKLARSIEVELGSPWLVCNTCESSAELNVRAITHGVQVFAPILAERGAGHIVNIIPTDFLHPSCPAVGAAALHAIEGLSESLHRELDGLRSPVGVSLVGPAHSDANFRILSAEHHNGEGYPWRAPAGEALCPERLAEEIFDAVTTRQFRVSSHGRFQNSLVGPELGDTCGSPYRREGQRLSLFMAKSQ